MPARAVAEGNQHEGAWPWERLRGGSWLGRLGLVALFVLWAWVLSTWPLTRAGAILLVSVVGLAIVLRPSLGLPLLALAVPFGSLRTVSVGPATVGAEEVLLAGVTLAWLARQLARQRLSLRWPAIAGAGLLLLAAMLVSFLPASSLVLAVKELLKWLELWTAMVLVLNLVEPADMSLLVLGLLAGGAAEGLIGLYQFLTGSGPEGFLLMGRFMRAAGTFDQPNPFGGYLGLTLPLAIGLVLTAWAGARTRGDWRGWLLWASAAVSAVLIAGGLIASWSRGAWLGAAAAVAVVLLARGGAWLRAVLAAVVVGVALSLLVWGRVPVPAALQQRLVEYAAGITTLDVRNVEVTDANFAVIERAAHWQAAVGMFAAHPWTGVGLGNYSAAYEDYALPRWPDPLGHAHNYYLNIAAEAGILGLAAYLVWVAAGFWLAIRAVRVSSGWKQGVALGVLGMLVQLGVHSLFDNLYVHGMTILVGLLLGAAAWIIAENSPQEATQG